MFGLIFFMIYIAFFTDFSLVFKIASVINGLCGMLFLGSFLVTTYQQYKTYKEVMGLYDVPEKDTQTDERRLETNGEI